MAFWRFCTYAHVGLDTTLSSDKFALSVSDDGSRK
jgi:hypothetical protein